MPDTLDGRFAVLATITALAMVRLEQLGERRRGGVGGADRALHRSDGNASIANWASATRPWARPCASWSARSAGGSSCGGAVAGEADWARRRATACTSEAIGRRRCAHCAAALASLDGGSSSDARATCRREARNERHFAHQLRLDQIRDGERIDLVADERNARRSPSGSTSQALDRLEAHAICRGRANGPRDGASRRIAQARAAWSPASRSRPMSTSRSSSCSCPNRRPAAGPGDRARPNGLRRRLPRWRDDRSRRGDRGHAGAQPRPLSAQRGRRSRAQGSGRFVGRPGGPVCRACGAQGPHGRGLTQPIRTERRRRDRCRTPPVAAAIGIWPERRRNRHRRNLR